VNTNFTDIWTALKAAPIYIVTIPVAAVLFTFAGMSIYGPPRTVVIHDPGPVHTVYSKQPEPPVKTVEIQLPQSCKDALQLSSTVANNAVTMADSSLPLMDAMKAAFIATVNGDKAAQNAAITKMTTINASTLKSKVSYASLYPQYTVKWQQCQKEIK